MKSVQAPVGQVTRGGATLKQATALIFTDLWQVSALQFFVSRTHQKDYAQCIVSDFITICILQVFLLEL